jgi:PRTRC genetic system ThiF family protein
MPLPAGPKHSVARTFLLRRSRQERATLDINWFQEKVHALVAHSQASCFERDSEKARNGAYLREVGLYKAQVLVNRLNVFWGLDWCAIPTHVRCGRDIPDCDFLISCVDTRAARATLAKVTRLKTRKFHLWIDTGNNADSGQFVMGEPIRPGRKDRSTRLPCIDELFPQMTRVSLDRRDSLPACSAAAALIRQYISERHVCV